MRASTDVPTPTPPGAFFTCCKVASPAGGDPVAARALTALTRLGEGKFVPSVLGPDKVILVVGGNSAKHAGIHSWRYLIVRPQSYPNRNPPWVWQVVLGVD